MTAANNTIPQQPLRPLRIYLGDLTYTTLSLATDAFPLNVGFIAAYASKVFGKEIDITLFKYVDDLEQALNDTPPDILALSNYPWNFNLGQEFFRMARALSPDTICVMGGPNIPLEDEGRDQFVKRNTLSTSTAYLEGEEAFRALMRRAMETGLDREAMKATPIDGFIHRVSDTEVVKGTMLPRRRDARRNSVPLSDRIHGQVLRRQAFTHDGNKSRMPFLLLILPRGQPADLKGEFLQHRASKGRAGLHRGGRAKSAHSHLESDFC